jgi:hypothetical protein
MSDLSKLSDAELQALYRLPAAPSPLAGMSDDDLKKAYSSAKPQGFMANAADFFKSIPRGLVQGATSMPNPSMVPIQDEELAMAPVREGAKQTLLNQTHAPQGAWGKGGQAIGEGLGNPASWLGPGGVALKAGGAVLSSAASEAAGQATEGSKWETPARLAGALTGGAVAGKAMGPGAPKAAVPTAPELFDAARTGYKQAGASGLEINPGAVSSWATKLEQELLGPEHGFTGGAHGVAPKTLGVIAELQNVPAGAVVTASNIDALRKNLGRIAQETQPAGPGGVAKPTADAAAASVALKRLNGLVEDLPPGAVMAGDAAAYVRATNEANKNWAAGQRTSDFDARLTKAENATDRQVAGSLDSQIKIKAGQLLDNASKVKGLSDAEKAQLQLINSGDWKSNILRQLGRGGAGVIPLTTHAVTAGPLAAATGGQSILPQAALAAALYGARKGSEAITKNRAQELAEMLAKRSPEYERRVANLPPQDMSPGMAAIARALLNSQ